MQSAKLFAPDSHFAATNQRYVVILSGVAQSVPASRCGMLRRAAEESLWFYFSEAMLVSRFSRPGLPLD